MSSTNDPDHYQAQVNSDGNQPDYIKLVKFLCNPFLDSPESLRIDCEQSSRTKRILIRLAIEGEDKGRVFGRGGRNLQAIRTTLQAIAGLNGYNASLEVFGSSSSSDRSSESGSSKVGASFNRRRRPPSKPHRSKNSNRL